MVSLPIILTLLLLEMLPKPLILGITAPLATTAATALTMLDLMVAVPVLARSHFTACSVVLAASLLMILFTAPGRACGAGDAVGGVKR